MGKRFSHGLWSISLPGSGLVQANRDESHYQLMAAQQPVWNEEVVSVQLPCDQVSSASKPRCDLAMPGCTRWMGDRALTVQQWQRIAHVKWGTDILKWFWFQWPPNSFFFYLRRHGWCCGWAASWTCWKLACMNTCINTTWSLVSWEPHLQISLTFGYSRWVPCSCQNGQVSLMCWALACCNTCQSHVDSWVQTCDGLFGTNTPGIQQTPCSKHSPPRAFIAFWEVGQCLPWRGLAFT